MSLGISKKEAIKTPIIKQIKQYSKNLEDVSMDYLTSQISKKEAISF